MYTMSHLKVEYTVEEQEAAMILCHLNMWNGTFDNDSDLENIPPSYPSSPSSPDISYLNVASSPMEPLPGPSSATDLEYYDSGKNDSSTHQNRKFSYKLNLYERYKKEQREWALEKMRLTAADNVTNTSDQEMDAAGDRPKRNLVAKRKVLKPRSKRNVNVIRPKEIESEDSDNTYEQLPGEKITGKTKIGNILVSSRLLKQLPTLTPNKATRKLLDDVFPRRVLATHSLTGRPSPAFPDKPVKRRLDPAMVKTIIDLVLTRCKNANERAIRFSITTKCADECKMLRYRLSKEG